MAKISRIQQISDELTRLGVEPTQEAIEAVQAILRNDNRKTYKTACKAYHQQLNPQTEQPKSDRQTSPASDQSQNPTEQLLVDMTVNVSDNQVNFINNAALNLTMHRILSGDLGQLTPETKQNMEQFKQQMQEVKTVDVSFLKPALPTSQKNLLPSSEEIFDNAVVGLLTISESTS